MKKVLFLICLTITLLSCNKDKDLGNVKPIEERVDVPVPNPQITNKQNDIIEYLFEYGFAIYEYPKPKSNTLADYICHTSYNGVDYWTTIHYTIIEHKWELFSHTNAPYP